MEYSLLQKEATLAVIIVSLLTLLVLVLLVYLQRKHRNKKGGAYKSNEEQCRHDLSTIYSKWSSTCLTFVASSSLPKGF